MGVASTAGLWLRDSSGEALSSALSDTWRAVPRITTLQWAISVFCAFTGALMIVAPHQFSGPVWSALQGQLPLVGSLFFLAGVVLVGCTVMGAPPRWVAVSHFGAVAALLPLIYNLAVVGLWQGAVFQITFALGTVLAPFISSRDRPGCRRTGDFFALVLGTANAVYGLLMLVLPDLFRLPIYDPIRPSLSLYGAAFLVTSVALGIAQFRPAWPRWLDRIAHLAILAPCACYALAVPIPSLTWTGIVIYCGLSPLVATLPWTGHLLRQVDSRSFSFRLAFTLGLAAALPMIAITGVVTSEQERRARAEAEGWLEASAISMASDVAHYIGSIRGSVVALASYPRLLELPPADQQAILHGFEAAFPDALLFLTYDAAGTGIARSDGLPLIDGNGVRYFEDARRTNAPSLEVRISRTYGVPLFAIAAPIRASDGGFDGVVATALTSEWVAQSLNQSSRFPGSRTYVVDAGGRAIAHPDGSLAESFADISAANPVAKVLTSRAERGVVSSADSGDELLAAYARVPDLGWAVVVDQPAASALATVRNGRNVAFGMLLAAVALAVVAGSLLASSLSDPLATLSQAARRLAHGDSGTSLPWGGTSEIRDLVTAFREMRDQLVARQAEKERLLIAERDARAQAETAVRVRDEFLSVAAHELKTPITSLRGYAQLLLRQLEKSRDLDPARVSLVLTTIDQQSQRLTSLVNQLLDLSRIDAGKLTLDTRPTDIPALVEGVVVSLRQVHAGRDFAFVADGPMQAEVDALRLEQVIANLLDNAVKFSPPASPIEVAVGIDVVASGQIVTIEVRDYGRGIPAEKRARIFDRYYQAHDEWHGGLGLGLFISRQIVGLHGGTIAVECPADGGSRFIVRLPAETRQDRTRIGLENGDG